MYIFKYGRVESNEQAYNYYKLAVDQNYELAWAFLAECYEEGIGIPRSFKLAFKYFKLSAKAGIDKGLLGLYWAYRLGFTGKISFRLAKKYGDLYIQNKLDLAEVGDIDTVLDIGWAYFYGTCVHQSYDNAFTYFKKASEKGNSLAQYLMGVYYEHGYNCEISKENADRYYQLSADQGNLNALITLAYRIYWGVDQSRTFEQAINYCRLILAKTSFQGDVEIKIKAQSQYLLAYCYENGKGTKISYRNALFFYICASKIWAEAMTELGKIHRDGRLGLTPSYKNAIKCFVKAAYLNDSEGGYLAAKCYLKGLGVKKSDNLAYRYFKFSADSGNLEAIFDFYNLLIYGDWIYNSLEEGIKYLKIFLDNETCKLNPILYNRAIKTYDEYSKINIDSEFP